MFLLLWLISLSFYFACFLRFPSTMSNNEARQGSRCNHVTAQTFSTSPQTHQFNRMYNQAGQEVSAINHQIEHRTMALGQRSAIRSPLGPTTMYRNQARYTRQHRYQYSAMSQPLPTNAQTRPSNMFYNQPMQILRSINNHQNDYRNFVVAQPLPTSSRPRPSTTSEARQGLNSINNNLREQQQFSMARPFPNDVHNHPCHLCNKVFETATDLGGHMRIHNANNTFQARERNLSATLTLSQVESALRREELRKKAQRPISSSSLDNRSTFGTSTSVTYPRSVLTPTPFLASRSLDVYPIADAESFTYRTRPFLHTLDKPIKRFKIESDELSEEMGKKSEKLDLTLRL